MVEFQGRAARLVPPGSERYSHGWRSEVVDPFDRDVFMLMLMQAAKHRVKLVADFMIQRIGPAVAAQWAENFGCKPDGILLSADANGTPVRSFSNAMFPNPAHPAVRKQMIDFCEELGKRYGALPSFGGIRHRFWKSWPGSFETWFWNENLGCDDWTVAEFARESGIPLEPVNGDPVKFAERKARLNGELRNTWFRWRAQKCLSLRAEMLAALRRHAPQARFYVDDADKLAPGSGLDPEYFKGRSELGWQSTAVNLNGEGVEWNSPDPVDFANFNRRPAPWGNPPLDQWGTGDAHQGIYPSGLCCNGSYRSHPYQLEQPALALADNRLERLSAGGQWCIPPADEGLRAFVRIWRAIPKLAWERVAVEGGIEAPAAVWRAREANGGQMVYAVNRTDSERTVRIEFAGKFAEELNPVDGAIAGAGTVAILKLPPFMPAVRRFRNAPEIVRTEIPAAPKDIAAAQNEYAELLRLEPLTAGARELQIGTGDRYADGMGQLGFRDRVFSFDELIGPMKKAFAEKRWNELMQRLAEFRKHHVWWYEAFGWPRDYSVKRPVGRTPLAGYQGRQLEYGLHTHNTPEDFTTVPGEREKFLKVAPGVPFEFYAHSGPGGWRQLELRGVFGGGRGPIRVEQNGKVLGRIPAMAGPERTVVRVFGTPVAKHEHHSVLRLIQEGTREMLISHLGFTALPPRVIREWSGVGPFKKNGDANRWESMEPVLPPETNPDYNAQFVGMNGRSIGWKKLDIGTDKFLPLEKLFPYDWSRGDGVAYLTTWIRAPRACSTTLYYSTDWSARIWVNGKLTIPKISGPTKVYAVKEISLRAGWNRILVKTACGSGGWNFAMAIGDCENFEYRATPPENAQTTK